MHYDNGIHIVNPEIVGFVVSQGLDSLFGPALGFLGANNPPFSLSMVINKDTVGALRQRTGLELLFMHQAVIVLLQGKYGDGEKADAGKQNEQPQFAAYREVPQAVHQKPLIITVIDP
jgi:hypothetical protein